MASNLIETTTKTTAAAATLDEAKEFPKRELLELFQEEIRFFDFICLKNSVALQCDKRPSVYVPLLNFEVPSVNK